LVLRDLVDLMMHSKSRRVREEQSQGVMGERTWGSTGKIAVISQRIGFRVSGQHCYWECSMASFGCSALIQCLDTVPQMSTH